MNFSVTLDMVLNVPLKSTLSVLEFSTVETTPLFDGFFGGGGGGGGKYSQSGKLGPLVKLVWFTEVQSPVFTRGYVKWRTHEGQGP